MEPGVGTREHDGARHTVPVPLHPRGDGLEEVGQQGDRHHLGVVLRGADEAEAGAEDPQEGDARGGAPDGVGRDTGLRGQRVRV